MAIIKLGSADVFKHNAESVAFLVEQDFILPQKIKEHIAQLFPAYESFFVRQNFTGKAGSSVVIPCSEKNTIIDLVFIGLGAKNDQGVIEVERYRRALGSLIRTVEARKSTTLALSLPETSLLGISQQELAKHTVTTLEMARYHFDQFITDKDRKIKNLSQVVIVGDQNAAKALQEGLDQGLIIAAAVNQCREWVDLPAESLHPIHLVEHAQQIAKKYGLNFTVYNEQEVIAMGMGGLAGVSQGSGRDCAFVILEYTCALDNAPTIACVGKGITFDSGGLSIKPAVAMENMKDDMSGAAAVINTMQVLGQLKPKMNVIGIAPISENLPSGTAIKPGDILRFYNGKTAEVKNTDAEGRLILADALSYAVKHYKLDAIIDLATLTGACVAALGPHFTGLMSKHENFVQRVQEASKLSGEAVWRLPLPDEYKVAIRSSVADMSNIGSQRYMAGATTAALFLQNFVDDVPWVHLDIAGSAYDVPDISYYRPESATGVGVRLLTELIMNWKS